MRRAFLNLPLFVVLGCSGGSSDETATSSPDGTSGGATAGTSSETSATPTTSETAADPTSGSADPSTSGSSTSATSVGETSTGEASTDAASTSSGEASTGDETTGGGDETTGGVDGDYAAFYVAGGLDRIMVRKRNVPDDLCTTVIFVWPMDVDPMGFAVELPGEWGVQNAMVAQGAAQCLVDMMFPMDPVFAIAGDGVSTWTPENGCPATLDIDVGLSFEMTMPWVPPQDHLDAQAIPVQGC